MKLFIIPGHGAGDPGACGHGYEEAERVRALAKRIKELGGDDVLLADFGRNYYEDGGIYGIPVTDDMQVVELHMDSGPVGAHGSHVIIQAGIGGADKYDNALAASLARIFPGRAMIVVERDDLANPARAADVGVPYRLVENGFISDAGDISTFNRKIDDIAHAYLETFGIVNNQKPSVGALYKVLANPEVNVRTKASSINGAVVGTLKRGSKVRLTNVKKNKAGNTWGKIAAGRYKGKWVAVVFRKERLLKKVK